MQRFEEILAEDFLCSNPDGSLVDKNQFLAQTALPVTIRGYRFIWRRSDGSLQPARGPVKPDGATDTPMNKTTSQEPVTALNRISTCLNS